MTYIVLTKEEAVIAQIEGAMNAYMQKDYACAITLAAAAEGATPEPSRKTLFHDLRDIDAKQYGWSAKYSADRLNDERNWLKHFDLNQPISMSLETSFAYIHRALDRFTAVYGRHHWTDRMQRFNGYDDGGA